MNTLTKVGIGVGAAALVGSAALGLKGCSDYKAAKEAAALENEGNLRKIVQSDAEILRLRASINLHIGKRCTDAALVSESRAEVDALETNRQQCIRVALTDAESKDPVSKKNVDYVVQCEPKREEHRVNTTCISNNFSENPRIITAIVRCNETLVAALDTTDRTLQSCGRTKRW